MQFRDIEVQLERGDNLASQRMNVLGELIAPLHLRRACTTFQLCLASPSPAPPSLDICLCRHRTHTNICHSSSVAVFVLRLFSGAYLCLLVSMLKKYSCETKVCKRTAYSICSGSKCIILPHDFAPLSNSILPPFSDKLQ